MASGFQDSIPDVNDPNWNKMSADALVHKRAVENLSRREAGLAPLPEVKEEVKVEERAQPRVEEVKVEEKVTSPEQGRKLGK